MTIVAPLPKLTKRSTTRLEQGAQPDPVFFIDRNLGSKKLPDALRSAGWKIEVHEDHFPDIANKAEEDDTRWITFAGQKQWTILTADKGILFNPLERDALNGCGTLAFMLAKKNLSGEQMAAVFIEARVQIWRKIKNHKPPGIFKIRTDSHQVELWVQPKSWAK
jgi:hypothetical protein